MPSSGPQALARAPARAHAYMHVVARCVLCSAAVKANHRLRSFLFDLFDYNMNGQLDRPSFGRCCRSACAHVPHSARCRVPLLLISRCESPSPHVAPSSSPARGRYATAQPRRLASCMHTWRQEGASAAPAVAHGVSPRAAFPAGTELEAMLVLVRPDKARPAGPYRPPYAFVPPVVPGRARQAQASPPAGGPQQAELNARPWSAGRLQEGRDRQSDRRGRPERSASSAGPVGAAWHAHARARAHTPTESDPWAKKIDFQVGLSESVAS